MTDSAIREAPPPAPRWQSVRVDRGWPPTWERTHCGSCEAPWWTLERTTEGWRLWRLPSRAAYDYGRVVCVFPTAGEADAWLVERMTDDRERVCDCSDDGPRPSVGHIAFRGPFEFFEVGGEVYRASVDNAIQTDGRRHGRWECSRAHFDRFRAVILGE